jgi:hypothetical protein
MSRRAQIFDFGMILAVLGAMIGIFLVFGAVANETSQWQSIGQRAFQLQNTYAQGDYFVNFMATGAHWASARVVQQLGQNGGFAQPPCGTSKGVALWNKQDAPTTTCLPTAYENFYALLGKEMDKYIALYAAPHTITVADADVNVQAKPFASPYEFLITKDKLTGIATAPIAINLFSPQEQVKELAPLDLFGLWTTTYTFNPAIVGVYVFRPNFETAFPYNLDVYAALGKAAQRIVPECAPLNSTEEKKACAQVAIAQALAAVNETKSSVAIDAENNIYTFTITQDGQKSVLLGKDAPTIRFALVIPTAEAPVSA